MEDSKQRKIGAFLSYVSIAVSTFVQLLYTPFLIKMLGSSEYGLYSLVNSIIGYLTVLDLGFGNAIVVYTAKYRAKNQYDEEKKLHGMFFIVFCIIGFISGLLGLLLYFNVEFLFSSTMSKTEIQKVKIMMLIMTINLVFSFIFSIYSSILNAYEKFTFQKVMSILNTIIKPIIMIPLLFLGFKSISMVLIVTIVNIAVLLSNYIYCKHKLKINIKYSGFDKKIFVLIIKYSIWIFIGKIVDKVNWSVDQFVLGAVSGTIAVSIYSVASTINTLFLHLSTAVSGVFLPKMSKLIANNVSNNLLTKEFNKVGRIQYYIIFLMASGFVLFGKSFILTWVGSEYIDSYYIALILIIPLCIPLIQNLGISIMQAKNMHRFKGVLTLSIAFVNVIISIPLAKMYQGIGSAIGTSLSLIIGNIIIMNIYYYKKVKIDVTSFWKEIFRISLPFPIPIIVILLLMNLIKLTGYLNLIVYGFIYTCIYFVTIYKLSMNDYERDLVNKIFRKIHFKR